jgi:ABC-type metal ion transport system, periplasmic component/surface adhesin
MDKTVTDPHAWNNVANGVIYAQNITEGLAKADPQDASLIKVRGAKYVDDLRALDSWVKQRFSPIPREKRKVLTSHDAFGYFAKAYQVDFLSPQGLSSESEANAAEVGALIKQIKADGVHTWFMENQLDPRLVKQIASATGAQAGGELYPEALSKPGGVADSYMKMVRHNVDTIVKSME